MKSRFVFYFPYHGYGGVPILFLRLAEKLTELGFNVSIVDFHDGYMAREKSSGIDLIVFESLDQKIKIPPNSTLILQSDLPWGIPQNFECDSETTIFFWNCYPFNLIPVLPAPLAHFFKSRLFLQKVLLQTILSGAQQKAKKFAQFLIQYKALAFMDFPNWKMTFNLLEIKNLPKIYLQICLETKSLLKPKNLIQENNLKIAWLGRIADFKIQSVLRIIKDLPTQKKIEMTLIGSGDYESQLQTQALKHPLIQFIFIKAIAPKELYNYLNQNVDLLFAMGTSALEGGVAGVPTVLMDFSYSEINSNYRYNFLFDSKDYSLGDLVSGEYSGYQMQEIVNNVISDKIELAQKTQSYVYQYHSIEKQVNLFLDLSLKSKLKYNSLIQNCDLQKPGFYKYWAYFKKYFLSRSSI